MIQLTYKLKQITHTKKYFYHIEAQFGLIMIMLLLQTILINSDNSVVVTITQINFRKGRQSRFSVYILSRGFEKLNLISNSILLFEYNLSIG